MADFVCLCMCFTFGETETEAIIVLTVRAENIIIIIVVVAVMVLLVIVVAAFACSSFKCKCNTVDYRQRHHRGNPLGTAPKYYSQPTSCVFVHSVILFMLTTTFALDCIENVSCLNGVFCTKLCLI